MARNRAKIRQRNRRPTKLTPDMQEVLISGLLQTGTIRGALTKLPFSLSEASVSTFRNNNPDFNARVELAIKAHQARHPEQDFDLVLSVREMLRRTIKDGELEITERRDPKTGQVIDSQTVKRKLRFDPQIWQIVNPPALHSEQALLLVLAAAFLCLEKQGYQERRRKQITEFLIAFRDDYLDELSKRGIQPKHLEPSVMEDASQA